MNKKFRNLINALLLVVFLIGCTPAIPQVVFDTPTPLSINWAGLGLNGKLIFIRYQQSGNELVRMDLETGQVSVIFQAPKRAILSGAAVSPDQTRIALAYSPPPPQDESFVFPSIYLIPADGSAKPAQLIPGSSANDSFSNPAWSPDGQFLFGSHFHRGTGESDPPRNTVDRINLDGKFTPVLDFATWPAVSPDGQKLAYLSVDPTSTQNKLYLSNIDGSDPRQIVADNEFPTVDAPRFTPDGQSLLFSAANAPTLSSTSRLERLLGIIVASAHNVPSDFYSVTLDGSKLTRLTQVSESGLYPAISPDGQKVAFISQSGIYVMDIDGSHLQQIANQQAIGTLDWIR